MHIRKTVVVSTAFSAVTGLPTSPSTEEPGFSRATQEADPDSPPSSTSLQQSGPYSAFDTTNPLSTDGQSLGRRSLYPPLSESSPSTRRFLGKLSISNKNEFHVAIMGVPQQDKEGSSMDGTLPHGPHSSTPNDECEDPQDDHPHEHDKRNSNPGRRVWRAGRAIY